MALSRSLETFRPFCATHLITPYPLCYMPMGLTWLENALAVTGYLSKRIRSSDVGIPGVLLEALGSGTKLSRLVWLLRFCLGIACESQSS